MFQMVLICVLMRRSSVCCALEWGDAVFDAGVGVVRAQAADVETVVHATQYAAVNIVSTSIQVVVLIGLLLWIMGPSALAGLASILLILPVTGAAMARFSDMKKLALEWTDKRIKLMNEILVRGVDMFVYQS
jgi:hypothetical protein